MLMSAALGPIAAPHSARVSWVCTTVGEEIDDNKQKTKHKVCIINNILIIDLLLIGSNMVIIATNKHVDHEKNRS